MMMFGFWIVAALLVAAALAILLRPLVRQTDPAAAEGEPVTLLFRRQLAELEADLAQGRIEAGEAAAMRTEITRRMLAEIDRPRPGTATTIPGQPVRGAGGGRGDRIWRFATAAGLAGLVPAAALAVYYTIGAPAAITGVPTLSASASAAGPHSAADLAAAVTRLEARVNAAPSDLASRVMLGRTLAALGRFDQAQDAFRRAIALDPKRPELHAELGEILVLAAQGTVTPAAEAQFAKAPGDPRARFYMAEAAAQRGDIAGARRALASLLADAPADAPWRRIVKAGLAALASAEPPPAAAPAAAADSIPGPSAADIAAARAMTPEQQATMIRGMVARLAARLERHPDDREGWLRLAHAYDVIGEPDKAKAARARAAAPTPRDRVPQAAAAMQAPAEMPAADPAFMVAKLAAQLKQHPDDAAGWLMLARSYRVLGRTSDAVAALKAANQHVPGNLLLLQQYLNALAAGLSDGRPSPELVGVAGRINALDAKQPDALWYLGLAAAQHGDRFAAAKYWTQLVSELPAGSSERAIVQQKLDSLR